MIKVAVLNETKNPPDKRVAITPRIALKIKEQFQNVELVVQKSDIRCFSDLEYELAGITLVDDVSDADILIGVKEVKVDKLLANKKYLFFSHVAKKQPYNRGLLQEILNKNISLMDYEYFVDENNARVVAFGYWAGVVGAYNALRIFGMRMKKFILPDATQLKDLVELKQKVAEIELPPIKILITGEGRVAAGAREVLNVLNIKQLTVDEFLHNETTETVLCQIGPKDYVKRKDGDPFDLTHFFDNPTQYESTFAPFTKKADLYIACHFWDNSSPFFINREEIQKSDFKIRVIADVSCDIDGPIASTIRASTIPNPFYGYNRFTGKEDPLFVSPENISVMAVDNLPGSLPRDSSEHFADKLLTEVFPFLFSESETIIIEKATIAKKGKLTNYFNYLQDFVDGK